MGIRVVYRRILDYLAPTYHIGWLALSLWTSIRLRVSSFLVTSVDAACLRLI
jgi:hypothetical protein